MEFKVGQKVEVVEVKRCAGVKVGDIGEILSILKLSTEDKKREMCNFDLTVLFDEDIWWLGEDELKAYECKCDIEMEELEG